MLNYLTDFGFDTSKTYQRRHQDATSGQMRTEDYRDITFGPQTDSTKIIWTVLVYVFLALGLFARPLVVAFSDVTKGLNVHSLRWDVLLTSLIVALAMLSPLLKIISRINDGELSWQHCLTAFSIGFFSDLTFKLILDNFTKLISGVS